MKRYLAQLEGEVSVNCFNEWYISRRRLWKEARCELDEARQALQASGLNWDEIDLPNPDGLLEIWADEQAQWEAEGGSAC